MLWYIIDGLSTITAGVFISIKYQVVIQTKTEWQLYQLLRESSRSLEMIFCILIRLTFNLIISNVINTGVCFWTFHAVLEVMYTLNNT